MPQIEVTFEIDANGILNVGAEDKGTGKREKITITNDKGRLSPEEIERMVQEAEEFADSDARVKARVDAKHGLEAYAFNMKATLEDKLGDKVDKKEKAKVSGERERNGEKWRATTRALVSLSTSPIFLHFSTFLGDDSHQRNPRMAREKR